MSNIKQELENIKIPKELHERTKFGVKKAKLEQPKRRIEIHWLQRQWFLF